MRRAVLALCMFIAPLAFVGCGGDTSSNPSTKPVEEAQKEAMKMPPPPGVKTAAPKK